MPFQSISSDAHGPLQLLLALPQHRTPTVLGHPPPLLLLPHSLLPLGQRFLPPDPLLLPLCHVRGRSGIIICAIWSWWLDGDVRLDERVTHAGWH